MNVCLQITANLTIIFAPFLPFSMDKLRIFLNMDELNWSNLGRTDLLLVGHQPILLSCCSKRLKTM